MHTQSFSKKGPSKEVTTIARVQGSGPKVSYNKGRIGHSAICRDRQGHVRVLLEEYLGDSARY